MTVKSTTPAKQSADHTRLKILNSKNFVTFGFITSLMVKKFSNETSEHELVCFGSSGSPSLIYDLLIT